jgi:hypothetical protein
MLKHFSILRTMVTVILILITLLFNAHVRHTYSMFLKHDCRTQYSKYALAILMQYSYALFNTRYSDTILSILQYSSTSVYSKTMNTVLDILLFSGHVRHTYSMLLKHDRWAQYSAAIYAPMLYSRGTQAHWLLLDTQTPEYT